MGSSRPLIERSPHLILMAGGQDGKRYPQLWSHTFDVLERPDGPVSCALHRPSRGTGVVDRIGPPLSATLESHIGRLGDPGVVKSNCSLRSNRGRGA